MSSPYTILDASKDKESIGAEIARVVGEFQNNKDKRFACLVDLYRLHLDRVLVAGEFELIPILVQNGLVDVLATAFEEETDVKTLAVAYHLSAALVDCTPEPAPVFKKSFVDSLLKLLDTPAAQSTALLATLTQCVKRTKDIAQPIADTLLVKNSGALLESAENDFKENLLDLLTALLKAGATLPVEDAVEAGATKIEKEAGDKEESATGPEQEKWEKLGAAATSLLKALRRKKAAAKPEEPKPEQSEPATTFPVEWPPKPPKETVRVNSEGMLISIPFAKKIELDPKTPLNPKSYIKIVIAGNSGVGKSSILHRFSTGEFDPNQPPSRPFELRNTNSSIEHKTNFLQIVAPSGAVKYRPQTRECFSFVNGAILVYDITNRASFDALPNFYEDVQACIKRDGLTEIPILVVGSKADLQSQRTVTTEEGQKLAEKFNAGFYEASAKDDQNIQPLFPDLLQKIVKAKQPTLVLH